MNGFNEHGAYFSKIENYVNLHLDQTTKGKKSQKMFCVVVFAMTVYRGEVVNNIRFSNIMN
jgi:hypothetical protein